MSNGHGVSKSSSDKSIEQRLLSQLKLIDSKIKELEMMHLFLRICEINSHCLSTDELNRFFHYTPVAVPVKKVESACNQLRGRSLTEVLISLYER
jgi:hypothetical protein